MHSTTFCTLFFEILLSMGFVHIQKYLAAVAYRKCCGLVAHNLLESFYLFIREFNPIFSFSWHGINDLDPTFYLYHKDKKNISNYQYYNTLVLISLMSIQKR